MFSNRFLKSVHIFSTGWFVTCSLFLITISLRQTGMEWWAIFSLSGHSGVVVLFLTLVYIFAIFRGAGRSGKLRFEHPLTCSKYYMFFYGITPFVGAAGGLTVPAAFRGWVETVVYAASGTIFSTFLAWTIIDPALSFLEMLLPESREHRKERIASEREAQRRIREENERLLEELQERETLNKQKHRTELKPAADDLADLIAASETGFGEAETRAVELGAEAWRMGGISCMRQLHEMATEIYRQKYNKECRMNFIGMWWDGIGSWKGPELVNDR